MDSNFNSTEDYYVIQLGTSDKVAKEVDDWYQAWNDYFSFIRSSHKQMSDVITSNNDDDNENRIFKTPRRISRRKRSSALKMSSALKVSQQEGVPIPTPRRVSKRSISSAFKTQELFPTPRRVSKRGKHSSPNKSVHNESIVIMDLEENEPKNENIKNNVSLELFSELSIKETDVIVESENKVENQNKVQNENKFQNESKIQNENKVKNEEKIEEEIKIDVNNESDKEWLTDDEDCGEKMETEEFFDATDEAKEKSESKRKLNTSINLDHKKVVPNSTSKPKKKKVSQYFTPQTFLSSRTTTRMQSRIANSGRNDSQTTPQTNNHLTGNTGLRSGMDPNIMSSGESNSQKYGSSSRSMRYVSRIQKPVPDTKALTASAAKRRQEAEEQRRIKLQASQEKEKRAIEKRQILIEQTVNEKKIKSQEKFSRAAEQRELQKQKESEKMRKEMEKREEQEKKLKKLEEERREIIRKKHEEMVKKTLENERRKQLQELKESTIKMQKQEELKRRQELEREKIAEQERMTAMIQQHNNSLQQKAVAQSFLKKCEQMPNPKVVLHKLQISPPQNLESKETPNPQPNQQIVNEVKANKTFVVAKDEEKDTETSVYDMTPPPKEHNYDNYDISEIKSDDDTDDERHPRKHIPNWARGSQFVDTLKRQYAKSTKSRERDIKTIFQSGVQFPVELGSIFGTQRSVHSKYFKRTSSAVWNSPPALNSNLSINSSQSESSFRKN